MKRSEAISQIVAIVEKAVQDAFCDNDVNMRPAAEKILSILPVKFDDE
jgi:hypothetical protein